MTILPPFSPAPLAEASICVLETERLVLRKPLLEDAAGVAALANDRRIAVMTAALPHPYTVADAEEWILSTQPDWPPGRHPRAARGQALAAAGTFAATGPGPERLDLLVIEEATGRLVGAAGFVAGAAQQAPGDFEIGYWFGSAFWGRGYATETARAVIDHAFAAHGARAVTADVRVTNEASRRVVEKCGFQWAGAGLARIRALGSSVPVDRFRLDRRCWESLRAWGRRDLPAAPRLTEPA